MSKLIYRTNHNVPPTIQRLMTSLRLFLEFYCQVRQYRSKQEAINYDAIWEFNNRKIATTKRAITLKNKKEFGQGLLFIILEMEDFVFLSEV